MKLYNCPKCRKYTLKSICENCKEKTKDAHYKFIKLKAYSEIENIDDKN